MHLSFDDCEAVILSGGQSNRMGTSKALLLRDEQPMLQYIHDQLTDFSVRCLSSNDPTLDECLQIPVIRDVYEQSGPLGGIHAAMIHSKKQAIFVVPCDLPFFCREIPGQMLEVFREDADVMVCVDSAGRVHPLCGIYRCRILPKIENELRKGNCRVQSLLQQVKCEYFDIGKYFPENVLYNMNTPADYREFQKIMHLRSRRNVVKLIQTDHGKAVLKEYRNDETWAHEQMVYQWLQNSTLPHAKIIEVYPKKILLTHLPGRVLTDWMDEQEATGIICWDMWDKLVSWLTDFYHETGLVMTDPNLRNFIYDAETETLYGLDFEECAEKDITESIGRLAAFLLLYDPSYTRIKQAIADCILRKFVDRFNIKPEVLLNETKKQEAILRSRRMSRQ